MESANFRESNATLEAPPGRTADEIAPLCVHVSRSTNEVISCWKPTLHELQEISRTGRVWLRIQGQSMPPAYVSGHSPFAPVQP